MPYTNVNELLEALRQSLAEHPAERDTLKAIATIARRDGLEAGIAAYEDWKRSRLTNAPNDTAKLASPAASSPVPAHVNQPDDTSHTAATQNASGGITAQSTQPDKAGSQPDAAVRLQAQIEGCLIMEPDPALRLFLERLHRDSNSYPAEFVRQEVEVYLQSGSLDDFLIRLAALHLSWALDDVAADPDGKRLKRGNTRDRALILEAIRKAFEQETQPVLRCYLAGLARRALTDPVCARERLDDYTNKRDDATWQWLAEVAVAGSPEVAFQWRLQAARRKVADADLHDYLDKLEQEARVNLPEAVSKLEAFARPVAPIQGAPAA